MIVATLPENYQLLDLPQALDLAVEVVAGAGANHRYFGDGDDAEDIDAGECQYVTEYDEPDCLVARILYRYGVPIAVLKLWEGYSATEMRLGYERRPVPTRALLTHRAANLLETMQSRQDDNVAWGDVLEHGRIVALRLGVTL